MNETSIRSRLSDLALRLATLSLLASAPFAVVAEEQGSARGALQIDEVVVTARRVEESLQSAPVAVSAFNATELDRMFAQDLRDVGGYAPNVTIQAKPGFRASFCHMGGEEIHRCFHRSLLGDG